MIASSLCSRDPFGLYKPKIRSPLINFSKFFQPGHSYSNSPTITFCEKFHQTQDFKKIYTHFVQIKIKKILLENQKSQLNLFHAAFPASNYLLKVNNKNTRTRREICLKLKIKTRRRSCVFIVNFEHILHLAVVFLLLALSR